jgi:hypothetical protein
MNCTLQVNVKGKNRKDIIVKLEEIGLFPLEVRDNLFMDCTDEDKFWKFIELEI